MGAVGSSYRLDPGWLLVAAGLTLCVAGVLIPAQRSLHDLGGQLTRIEHLHAVGRDGIEAHKKFLDRLRQRDPSVFRRLAAAQLNLMPAGDTPLLVANSRHATVTDWIGRSVAPGTTTAAPPARTWLTSLTEGTRRLWVLGFGVLIVFIGLLVDGRPPAATANVEWSDHGSDEDGDKEGEWDANSDADEDEDEDEGEDEGEDEDDGEEEFDDEDEEFEEDDTGQDDQKQEWEQEDEDYEDEDEEDEDEEEDDDEEESEP